MSHPPSVPGDLLDVSETAAYLKISEATIYRRLRKGTMPGGTRLGKSWRVDPQRLDEALFGDREWRMSTRRGFPWMPNS